MEPGRHGALLDLDLAEHGRLTLPLAGIGGRALAALIDFLLFFFVSLAIVVVMSVALAGQVLTAELMGPALVALLGLLPLAGPLVFELLMRGQTPGKRVMSIRVISADGSPPGPGQLLLRNVLRLVDFMPMGYLVGLIAMFASSRGQRLGDMVGGTLVVREDPGALQEITGYEPIDVPPELHGVPEAVLRGARLLMDPARGSLPAPVVRERIADIARVVRAHRPDLAQEDDAQIWARLGAALRGDSR